ncbi:unnamed protein product [Mytilus coruscus]|uniref:Uncharacterized protein n=1 Tax=Mytilus coruscus TaxID=42192 RepID=A0A6J8B2Q3_MYTCO|nr:unnamed protein product [Mytilus coruscus]
MSRVEQLFKGINKNDIQRPTGQVDIFIGTDCCIFDAQFRRTNWQSTVDEKSVWVLHTWQPSTTRSANIVNNGIVRIYWTSGQIIPLNDIHVLDRDSIKDKLDSLFDIEGPGKQTTLKCGSGKCGKYAIGQSQYSIREERELNIIKSGMTHDEETQQWIVHYPWIKNPNNLPNNVNLAVSRLGYTEKRLLQNSLEYVSAYNKQIMDMVKRGIARKLTYFWRQTKWSDFNTCITSNSKNVSTHLPDASKMVIRNNYVDYILQSVESVDNARSIIQQIENMLACGGFLIKHWIISGNEKCGSAIQSQDSGEPVEVDLDESAHEKILGMRWDPKQDLISR